MGHSLGGYKARLFAENSELAGLLLIVIAGNQHGNIEIDKAWAEYQIDIATLSDDSYIYN